MPFKRIKLPVVLGVLVLCVAVTSAASRWFHVRVQEEGGEQVKVNLPMSLITMAIPLIDQDEFRRGRVQLGREEITVAELREMWRTLRAEGNYELATVESGETRVRVHIEGDYLHVNTVDGSETDVQVKVPTLVVDALLSGEGDELNVAAAVEALAGAESGDLVTVRDGGTHVRVWIDDSSSDR